MGQVTSPTPAVLILGAFSRHPQALDWAREKAAQAWSPIVLESERFVFDQTPYYHASMGERLLKTFWAFETLIDQGDLPDLKILTNQWEQEYQQTHDGPEPRALNLDPGYITLAKLVLATTKDRDHRIYLRRGIYAEGTLHYHQGAWRSREWTYPDYQQAEYHEFFTRCRNYLRSQR